MMLLVVFFWQFYVVLLMPFPRWLIPLVAPVLITVAALRRPVAALVPLGLFVTRPAPSTAGAATTSVRVMTYNIRSGVDAGGQLRPDVTADVIRSYAPDVVVLQEVGRGWSVHGGIDVLTYLQDRLQLKAVYVGAADSQFGNVRHGCR